MERKLENLRHSLAHLLASAVLKIDPKAKLGIGPTTEDGFYYDFLFSIKIDESILIKLEEIMKDLIKKNLKFVGKKVSFQEAKKIFKGQPFKLELLDDLKKYGTTDFNEIQLKFNFIKPIKAKKKKAKKISKVTIYQTGDFIDLCQRWSYKKYQRNKSRSF
jgi:threonyl-tRNA synthetase